ncbi:hypothetical protein BH23ACI1_BH23ACI1_02550 [soil metagenome]
MNRPGALRLMAASMAVAALAFLQPAVPAGLSHTIVISQVYGGGGNSGATYTHDYIELFNRGDSAVSVTGWSVQYASAAGTTWQTTSLNGTIPAGGYYLVQQAPGAGGTTPLPTPDATGVIPMSATAGKVALTSSATALSGTCPSGATIVDFVGFGTAANCSETVPTPTLSNTTAAIRNGAGCTDTDHNGADFTVGAPAPRNSASPLSPCTGPPALSINDVTVIEGDTGTLAATFMVSLSSPAPPGGVTFDIATADGTATVADNDYEAKNLTGQFIPAGEQTYIFEVLVIGDTNIEPNEEFFVNLTSITGALPGRTQGVGTILNDDFAPPAFDVVISQVYGGGGNAGATYTHDFVELFNRGTESVSLGGWSVQYTSATGTGAWAVTPLSGTIQPGRYYLVQQAAGAGGTTGLPSPDAVGGIAMAAGAGKVALHATPNAFSGVCPAGSTVIDVVGYGINSTCFEGSEPAANLSNTTAAARKRGGCFDSNDNGTDFLSSAPTPRNSAAAARSCDYQTLAIHDIQGAGLVTPYFGQDVTTTGIVTGIKTNGFFLQTPDEEADADPATSQALFVFTGGAPAVTVTDGVVVRGTATEFFDLTQIEATIPGDVVVTTTSNPLPMAVVLTTTMLDPTGLPTQLERFEGMRVQAPAVVSVAPTNQFGEIDAVLTGVARPIREEGIGRSLVVPPDPETGVVDCCVPRWDENPERIMIDTDGLAGMPTIHVTSKTTLTGITGPLDFAFGRYKVLPEAAPGVTGGMSATPVPAAGANEFTVGSYNIENFNSTKTVQLRKAARHIRNVMRTPDIIGVIEIANLASLEALAAQIDEDAADAGDPLPAYQARLIPASPTAMQNVGFLVKTSRVQVQSVTQELADERLDGTTAILHDRPPLVLRATVDPGGTHPGEAIVLVNHLRSFIRIEGSDAEGARVRAKRTQQAESLARLLQDLQTAHPGTPIISAGDYNAFEFSDGYTNPLAIIKGIGTATETVVVQGSPDLVDPDFLNLTDLLPAGQRYTYIFEGTPQAIDHILVNTTAQAVFQRYAVARSNADFPRTAAAGFTGDPSVPEGNSDHDSPVAYFAFPGTPVVTLTGGAIFTHEAFTPLVDPGATAHGDDGSLPVTTSGFVNVNVPGSYVLTYSATNGYWTTHVERTVVVSDTIAPAIQGFSLTPTSLGAPNHLMVDVALSFSVTDASNAVSCAVGVASNEPATGIGDGNTAVDWEVVSTHHVRLRAERSGAGAGRIYTVTLTCADPSGNVAAATATATVSKGNP